jgi:hypothetical protein
LTRSKWNTPLDVDEKFAPALRALPHPGLEADEFLLALGCGAEGRIDFGGNACNEILSLSDDQGTLYLSAESFLSWGLEQLELLEDEVPAQHVCDHWAGLLLRIPATCLVL